MSFLRGVEYNYTTEPIVVPIVTSDLVEPTYVYAPSISWGLMIISLGGSPIEMYRKSA